VKNTSPDINHNKMRQQKFHNEQGGEDEKCFKCTGHSQLINGM